MEAKEWDNFLEAYKQLQDRNEALLKRVAELEDQQEEKEEQNG